MRLYRPRTDTRSALVVGFRGQEGGHLVGFDYYRQELLRNLGLQITRVDADSLAAVQSAVDQNPCDVAFISLDWRWRDFADNAHVDLFRRLHQRNPRPRLIFLDCVDQTSSPFFELAPYVDAFGKAKLLRDLKLYQEDYRGGFIFADWFSRRYQFDLTGWYFGSRLPLGQESKLVPIWSFGILPRYQRRLLWNWVVPGRWERRPLDLNVRFTPGPSHEWKWYHEHRGVARDAARGLSPRMSLSGEGRIRRRRYLGELKRSKMVLSPFGWGEICYRDYEAFVQGALLIKPSVAHLVTEPDIFREHETYVPIQWDFADLEAVCEHYLRNPDEARQMVRTARERLFRYYREERFTRIVERLLAVAYGAALN